MIIGQTRTSVTWEARSFALDDSGEIVELRPWSINGDLHFDYDNRIPPISPTLLCAGMRRQCADGKIDAITEQEWHFADMTRGDFDEVGFEGELVSDASPAGSALLRLCELDWPDRVRAGLPGPGLGEGRVLDLYTPGGSHTNAISAAAATSCGVFESR